MRLVAWWALLSSGIAPVVLVGGWTVAEVLQGPDYNPVTQTISVLAAGAPRVYWVLTAMLVSVGSCYLLTAWGLHAAHLAGRLSLGGGGLSAILLAIFPAPATGGSLPHGSVVTVGFTLLALWPVLATRRRATAATPWGLRPAPSIAVSALMWLGALWFVIELQIHGSAGVAERVVTSLQSLWPVIVVISCLRHSARAKRTA
ncbi:MAG: hypothetical protein QOF98_37 [Streptomyces sp.]|nr:hypothetical protein [Streptomyces sp.]